MEKIDFIGIGAQKCASSWLYAVLEKNENFVMSYEKELNFFTDHYDRGYLWYEKNFPEGNGGLKGEVSPSYFYNTDAPARAYRYNPKLKIIITLRHPVERMFSNHLHEIAKKHIGLDVSFSVAFKNNPLYLEQSLYFEHVKRWVSVFGKDNVHIIFQENVRKDPYREAEKLLVFFNKKKSSIDHVDLNEKINESVYFKNDYVRCAMSYVAVFFRNIGLSSFVDKVKAAKIVSYIYGKNKVPLRDLVPELTKDEKELYLKLFENDIKKLSNFVDIPWSEFSDDKG